MSGIKVADFFAELGIKVDTKEIQKLDKALEGVRKTLRSVSKYMKDFGDPKTEVQIDKKRHAIEKMINRLEEAGGEVTKFRDKLAGVSKRSEFDKLALDIDKAREAQRRLNREAGVSGRRPAKSDTQQMRDRLVRQQGFQDLFVTGRRAPLGSAERNLIPILNKLKNSIDGTESSYRKANNSLRSLVRETKAAQAQTRAFERRVGSLKWTTEALSSSFGNMARSYVGAFAIMGAAQKSFRVAIEQEGFRARLALTSKDKADAKDTVEYVESTSNRLGLKMLEFGSSFTKFQASISPDEMSKDQIKDVFTGVSEAITAFALTGQEAGFVQRALVQMASKGKISMEELRLQMGENMPGAIRFFAEGIGVSVAELNDMAKKGELISSKTLPKFAARLREVAAPALEERTKGLSANINRMANAWADVNEALYEGGTSDAIKDVTKFLGETADGSNGLAKALGGLIKVFVRAGTTLINVLSVPFRSLNNLLDEGIISSEILSRTLSIMLVPAMAKLGLTVLNLLGPFKKIAMIAALLFIVIEEVQAAFDPNKQGFFEELLDPSSRKSKLKNALSDMAMDFFELIFGGKPPSEAIITWGIAIKDAFIWAWSEIFSFLADIHKRLGNYIIEGITQQWSNLVDKFKKLGSSMWEGFKENFKGKSAIENIKDFMLPDFIENRLPFGGNTPTQIANNNQKSISINKVEVRANDPMEFTKMLEFQIFPNDAFVPE